MKTEIRKFIEAKIAVSSNRDELIYPALYMDLDLQISNPQIWRNMTSLGPSHVLSPEVYPDANLYIINESNPEADLYLTYDSDTYFIRGPINLLEEKPPDRRYTIFGCGGLLAKILLATLEDKHRICSLHATSLYSEDDHHLLVCIGGSGAGKTILMLEASVRRGYKVFTTEYTHFRPTDEGTVFFKGSLFDNVRVGNLIHDFPESLDVLNVTVPDTQDVWNTKVVVDFQPVQTEMDIIENPEVTLIFPKIESQRKSAHIRTTSSYGCLFNTFLNAGEIINRPRLYYGCLAVPSFDNLQRGSRRLELTKTFFKNTKIREAKTLFAGVHNCWPF